MIRTAPFLSTGWYFWVRSRALFAGLPLAIALLAIAARLPRNLYLEAGLGVATVFVGCFFLPLIAIFVYEGGQSDVVGTRSAFPPGMMVLPMRTRDLVLFPVLYAAAAQILSWAAFSLGVLQPLGIRADALWPGLAMLSFTTSLQAVCWSRTPFLMAKVVMAMVSLVAVSALSIVSGVSGLPPLVCDLAFAGLISLTVAASVWGLSRARHEAGGGVLAPPAKRDRPAPLRPPFRSAVQAQVWLEVRRNVGFVPTFAGMVFALLAVVCGAQRGEPATFLSSSIQTTDKVTVFLLGIPAVLILAASIGCAPRKPDVYVNGATLQPFFATRPLSSLDLIQAKFRAAAVSSIVTWVMVLVVLGAWLFCPAQWAGEATTMAGALFHVLSWRALPLGTLAAILLLILTWRAMIGGFCIEIAGRPWISFAYLGFVCVVFTGAVCEWGLWRSNPDTFDRFVSWMPAILGLAVAAKLASAAAAAYAMRRFETPAPDFVAKTAGAWLAAVFGLSAATWLAIPPSAPRPAFPIVLGIVALLIPLGRILWAPSALSWNRHR